MVLDQVPRVIIIGGGAAGFFGAIACAENTNGDVDIRIFEKSSIFLSKVKFPSIYFSQDIITLSKNWFARNILVSPYPVPISKI